MAKGLLFVLLLLTPFLYAQNQDPNNSAQMANTIPANNQMSPTIEVKSIQAHLSPFYYDEQSYRNPFLHPELAIPLIPGESYGPFLPLQSYRLNELRVTGLFWNTSRPKAFVVTPDKKTITVGIKDYIGENFGYVASIREKELVVIQTLEEQGQRYTTTKVLFLSNKAGRKR